MERWRASAMLIGEVSGAQHVFNSIRSDAVSQASLANEVELLKQNLAQLCAAFAEFADHVSQFVTGVEDVKARARDDAARKAKFDEEEIELPPDLQRPQ